MRAEVWRDPRTVIGGSDAGAHLDMMCGAIYSTALLSEGVREFGVISLEEAVHQLTDVPARLYGLADRGRIADGGIADAVLFDPERVGYETERVRYDFPGDSWRLYAEATGVEPGARQRGHRRATTATSPARSPALCSSSGRDTRTVTP